MKDSPYIKGLIFKVIFTWVSVFLIPLLLVGIITLVFGLNIKDLLAWYQDHRYIQSYAEFVMVGAVPLLFVIWKRENLKEYGVNTKNLKTNLMISLGIVILIYLLRTFMGQALADMFTDDVTTVMDLPLKIWYLFIGLLINGPIEVFFFIWQLVNTDRIFKTESKLLSKGLIVTVIIFALMHIVTTFDLLNAAFIALIFFLIGITFKYTKSSIGQMIAWTLINGMCFYYLNLLR